MSEIKGPLTVPLIVVNYKRHDLVNNLLKSLQISPDASMIKEVIIVENGTDQVESEISERLLPSGIDVRTIPNPNTSYASAINLGVKLTKGEILVVANNDVEFTQRPALSALINVFKGDEKIGIVGPQLLYPSGGYQRSHGRFPSVFEGVMSCLLFDAVANRINMLMRHAFTNRPPKPVQYVDGAFMVIKRRCFENVGGLTKVSNSMQRMRISASAHGKRDGRYCLSLKPKSYICMERLPWQAKKWPANIWRFYLGRSDNSWKNTMVRERQSGMPDWPKLPYMSV